MANINTSVVVAQNEKDDMKNALKDFDLTNLSDTDKWKIAESRSIQKIEDYMNSVNEDNSLDAQQKKKIQDNMLDIWKMRRDLDKKQSEAIQKQTQQVANIQNAKDTQKQVPR